VYYLQELKGDELLAQLDKWVQYGTIEAEARDVPFSPPSLAPSSHLLSSLSHSLSSLDIL